MTAMTHHAASCVLCMGVVEAFSMHDSTGLQQAHPELLARHRGEVKTGQIMATAIYTKPMDVLTMDARQERILPGCNQKAQHSRL